MRTREGNEKFRSVSANLGRRDVICILRCALALICIFAPCLAFVLVANQLTAV